METNPARPDKLYWMFAPALLISVAVVQIYFAKTHDLTPWKGGGFGMFSTLDGPDARWVRCYVIVKGRKVYTPIPPELDRQAERLRAMPSRERLRQLATDLGRMHFVTRDFDKNVEAERRQKQGLSRTGALPDFCTQPIPGCEAAFPPPIRVWQTGEREPRPSEIAPVEWIRVELWRYGFDLQRHLVQARRTAVATAPARPEL